MPFVVEGGFLCLHCRYVFPHREHYACFIFGEWGRDLCLRCCETHVAYRRMQGLLRDEKRHLAREEAFLNSIWAEEPPGGYDLSSKSA